MTSHWTKLLWFDLFRTSYSNFYCYLMGHRGSKTLTKELKFVCIRYQHIPIINWTVQHTLVIGRPLPRPQQHQLVWKTNRWLHWTGSWSIDEESVTMKEPLLCYNIVLPSYWEKNQTHSFLIIERLKKRKLPIKWCGLRPQQKWLIICE